MPHRSTLNRRYGWRPQLPDRRDRRYALRKPQDITLSPRVDLRPQLPAPYDQSSLGSCTANAIAAAVEYDLARQGLPVFMPARLFIYYNERVAEGTVGEDAGAVIRDGIKSINIFGVCPETEWPYDISQFAVAPAAPCYVSALGAKSLQYESVNQDLGSIKACLADGLPVVIGFTVYESFESAEVALTGVVPMPADSETVLGGHAVLVAGLNDTLEGFNGIPAQHFLVRNSWGTEWGAGGYCYMPFGYLLAPDMAADFWAIQVMA